MLALTRKPLEGITVITTDGPIHFLIASLANGKVRVAVEAPNECLILRDELIDTPKAEGAHAKPSSHR